ncbi:hypothetical protein JNB84_03275 [Rhizobium pusense]|uniref:hypothetical protein n=1 Tax=Agrobacterium pusense TaxID=648995 RepID=UPI001C6E1BD0|nr:hypothetical protein [Agrobacterium pusense]MBW9076962.1 hypothetical protein [Agrobacterium pusense]
MIRLSRTNPPAELTDGHVAELTDTYKRTSESVWNKSYIKEGLLALSSSKCAYCETLLTEESKYMEVEHFRCKKDFPDEVVLWRNLMPACKRCNGHKNDYNVETEGMIVDPFLTEPGQHLYIQNYRVRGRDDTGRRTAEILYLNDGDRLVRVRMELGNAIADSLEILRRLLEEYLDGQQSTIRRNRITRGIESLLLQAQPEAQFSAVAASVLLIDENFTWIKGNLMRLNLWGALAALEERAAGIALLP